MLHYTDALTGVIQDIITRVDALSFIDASRLLVFARVGRSSASGAYATCHCLNLPTSGAGYYFWKDRRTGQVTRRTQCFVTKTPEVTVRRRRIDYLISFALPRFCDQTLKGARKAKYYRGQPSWMAKLDTIVHELYHIGPGANGLRTFTCADGMTSSRNHSPGFFEEVSHIVRDYLRSRPDPRHLEFLRYDFAGLTKRYGTITATTFRNFPSYPQRYREVVQPQPSMPRAAVVIIAPTTQPARYTERDLVQRVFTERGAGVAAHKRWDSAA